MCIFCFYGCAVFTGYNKDIHEYENDIYLQNCDFKRYKNAIDSNDDRLYWALKGGMLARFCKNYNQSNIFFDIAEDEFRNSVDLKGFVYALTQDFGSTILNDNIRDYNGNVYERIMANIYKGLNFMSLNNMSYARVEFNRALYRQQVAKEQYVDEINKARKNAMAKASDIGSDTTYNMQSIDEAFKYFDEKSFHYKITSNFINPFATYMSGLFYLLDKDYIKAQNMFEELILSDSKNQQLSNDLDYAKNRNEDKQIWLIYENGKSVGLKEEIYHIPLFLFSNRIYHIGLAFSVLSEPKYSFSYINLNGYKTSIISDMNAVITTEYKSSLDIKIIRAILSSISKMSMQYGASRLDNGSYISTLLFSIYSFVTTRADIRHISTMPSNFQSVSIKNTGMAVISDENGDIIANIEVNKDKNVIIYVKSLNKDFNIIDKIEI